MNEVVVKKSIRSLLETSRKLSEITESLESDPIGRILGDIADIIWGLYDIKLQPGQCEDGFTEVIFRYQWGEIELEECIKYLDEF